MIEYLKKDARILLADVGLLEMIATLLPNLSKGIIVTLVQEIDACMRIEPGKVHGGTDLESVLVALKAFPLNGTHHISQTRRFAAQLNLRRSIGGQGPRPGNLVLG